MKRITYRIGIIIVLINIVATVQTYQTIANTVVSHHVVLSVGPNNAIVSSLLIGLGAIAMMIFEKMKENESSED